MEKIRIVEYKEEYAKSLAEMWNESSGAWFTEGERTTEDEIIERERKSSSLKVFLAVDEKDKVLGYADFAEYSEDSDASYLPNLNVIPSYHGKKIGKMLVKKVVEEAMKSKWSRLDLNSWEGNDKAIPLYKKCGFMWENTGESTHLMNFIPYLMHSEAISPYFQNLHWYDDGKREINMHKEGISKGNNDFYEYKWSKGEDYLIAVFDKNGRGLCSIENKDYKIQCTMKDYKLIAYREYDVVYHIENKTNKPLNIELQGIGEEGVEFDYDNKVQVQQNLQLKGKVAVKELPYEIHRSKTFPQIKTDMKINGKSVQFKMGVDIVNLLEAELITANEYVVQGCEEKMYLYLKNNGQHSINIKFSMVSNEYLELKQDIEVDLKALQEVNIEFNALIKSHGFYKENTVVEVESGEEHYNTKMEIWCALKSFDSAFFGESKKSAFLYNGNYTVELDKNSNDLAIMDHDNDKLDMSHIAILPPKIGMPYSEEFCKSKKVKITFSKEQGNVTMCMEFNSESFSDITVFQYIKLSGNGIVENYYELENKGKNNVKDIYLMASEFCNMKYLNFPSGDRVIRNENYDGAWMSHWENSTITENWIYMDSGVFKFALVLDKGRKIRFNQWYFYDEWKYEEIKPHEKVKSTSIYLCMNRFNHWQQVRNFAYRGEKIEELREIKDIEMELNQGDPFIKSQDIQVNLKKFKKDEYTGEVTLNNGVDTVNKSVYDDIKIPVNNVNPIQRICATVDLNVKKFERKLCGFKKQPWVMQYDEEIIDNFKVDIIRNGEITVKACRDYAPGIMQITYNEHDWLKTGFPKYEALGDCSPFTGGYSTLPMGDMGISECMKEPRSIVKVTMEDNFSNMWSGFKAVISFQHNPKYKGLTCEQYNLTLEGFPVMCCFRKYINKSPKRLTNVRFFEEKYMEAAQIQNECYLIAKDGTNGAISYKMSSHAVEMENKKLITFKDAHHDDFMNLYSCGQASSLRSFSFIQYSVSQMVDNICLNPGEESNSSICFNVFSQEPLCEEELSTLENVRFK